VDGIHDLGGMSGFGQVEVEKGVVTRDELEARTGGPYPLSRPVAEQPTVALRPQPRARFAVGDRIVVRDIHPAGHTRVPRYVRGKRGTVVRVAPKFSFPDTSANGRTPRSEHTDHVEFLAQDLWGDYEGRRGLMIVAAHR